MPIDAAAQDEKKAERTPQELSTYWQLQLELASAGKTKDWLDNGRKLYKRYKSEKDSVTRRNARRFNILYSNTEVLRAALYGKAAKPDVRRRFGDMDPTARTAAEIVERSLIYCAETYDVDKPIDAGVLDYLIPGRAVIRIEYEPVIKTRPVMDPVTAQPMTGEDGEPQTEEFIADQRLSEKYWFWEDFITGPARCWEDMPWIAFRHTMSRKELQDNQFKDYATIPLNWQPDLTNRKDMPEDLKKAEVFEIWNKEDRERIWIVKGFDKPLRTDEDPYGLEGFWPCPEPLVSYSGTDSYIPTPEFEAYSDQADDLDEITSRISRLTKALRRRGVYDQSVKELKRLANAGDNEFIPVENYRALSEKGGLQAAFQSEDISLIARTITDLMTQKEQQVQAIYEIMGIADIMRGATDPGETLGAQQLKAQFGSSRIKRRQRAVQKWIRDLYKIKAEMIAEHFEPQVLQEMTGTEVTPEVMQLLRSDKLRSYRIDIETDSTIFEDAEAEKKSRTEMVTGISKFMEIWGPIVQGQPIMIPIAFELLTFALQPFKIGKGVEDAIEQAKQQLTAMAQQQAQQPKQDPEMVKAEAEKAKGEQEMQQSREEHGLDMQMKGADLAVTVAKSQISQQDMAMKQAASMQPQGTMQ